MTLWGASEKRADETAAIDLGPRDTDLLAIAYLNRGSSQFDLGRFEAAVADATSAIDLEPGDPAIVALAYVNRADALGELGRIDDAIADARAALDLVPATHQVGRWASSILLELEPGP